MTEERTSYMYPTEDTDPEMEKLFDAWFPQSWYVNKLNPQGWMLCDQMGFIITHEEWDELRTRVDQFMEAVQPTTITYHNDHNEERHRAKTRNTPIRPKAKKKGYVYLIQGINTPWYKIGVTASPVSRLKTIDSGTPFEIRLLGFYAVNDMVEDEKFWHEKFSTSRADGEWFGLTRDEIDSFLAHCGE